MVHIHGLAAANDLSSRRVSVHLIAVMMLKYCKLQTSDARSVVYARTKASRSNVYSAEMLRPITSESTASAELAITAIMSAPWVFPDIIIDHTLTSERNAHARNHFRVAEAPRMYYGPQWTHPIVRSPKQIHS